MERLGLYFLILAFSLHFMPGMADSAVATDPSSATNFIKASCKVTLYPSLCVRSLTSYASKIQQSEKQLALAALSVSLARARSTLVFISKMARLSKTKPREYRAVKDCIDNIGISVDQLKRSIQELERMDGLSGQDFGWHTSNMQTWTSAALTNQNTCIDGFSSSDTDGDTKAAIKSRVAVDAQVTSNALALVNRFAMRHHSHQAPASTSLP